MSVAGIVCEYNPFHNGHAYQIRRLKEDFGMEAVVCAMSGHFMQRGEPAIIHKMTRARMALRSGADLVLELPAMYATRSAYWFALGGLSVLNGTGIVTHLAFGSETTDLSGLQNAAQRLAYPSPAFRQSLKAHLSQGLSFVTAQAAALAETSGEAGAAGMPAGYIPQLLIPSQPNDRLALSYLQIIAEKGYPLEPILIPRKGDAYHQTLPSRDTGLTSASAIRRLLQNERTPADAPASADPADLVRAYMPKESYDLIKTYPHRWVGPQSLAPILMHLLRRATPEDLRRLPDMTEGLENRIIQSAQLAGTMDEFYQLLKTKRYAMTRLQRAMTHLYLNYTNDAAHSMAQGAPYLRVLGCTAKGQALLQQMKSSSTLPVITKAGQLNRLSLHDPHGRSAWELEMRSGYLYALLQNPEGTAPAAMLEHQLKPVLEA